MCVASSLVAEKIRKVDAIRIAPTAISIAANAQRGGGFVKQRTSESAILLRESRTYFDAASNTHGAFPVETLRSPRSEAAITVSMNCGCLS